MKAIVAPRCRILRLAVPGLVVLIQCTFAVAPSTAQTTYTWNGANPGDWQVSTNWSPNGVPGVGDVVVIGSGQPVLSVDATVADVAMSAGSLSGDGNLTVTGAFTWSGGTLNGRDYAVTSALTIPDGAILHITGENNKGLRGRDIFNDGTIRWEGAGDLVVNWGTRIENRAEATFDLRTDATLTRSNGSLVIQNDGLLVKTAGAGTTSFNYPYGQFINNGIVRVLIGTLMLNNANASFSAGGDGAFEIAADATLRFNQATYNFGAASAVSGAGTLLVTAGTARIGRGEVTGPTSIAGGTLAFTDTETPSELADVALSAGRLGGTGVVNVNGSATWTGGNLGRSGGVINLLGTTFAEGDAAKNLGGGIINNAGLFTWAGTGNLVVTAGTSFNNLEGAHFDIKNDAVWTRTNGAFSFRNSGLVTKSAGTETTTLQTPFGPFNNNGEVRVESGTLYVRISGTGSNSTDTGAWIVGEGAALWFNLHQRTFTEAATIGGTGTTRFLDSATIINRGTVQPGLSAGTLTVQDNYPSPRPAGVLEIELGGTAPDTEHDVFDVTNIANLGGVLRLVLIDGFEPTGEEEFTIVTALAVQGTFADVEPPDGYVAEATYGAQEVKVRVVPIVACDDGLAADEHTVAMYKFDEPLPGTSFDASGNGLDLTDNGTEVAEGRFCGARRFDGVDDAIDMNIVRDSLQGSTGWTIEYVARSVDSTEVPVIKSHTCGNGWNLQPASSVVGFGIKTTAVGGNCPWVVSDYSSAQAAMDTLWHYYALSWDGDSLRVYRDGDRIGGAPAGGVFLHNQNSNFRAWLGRDDFANDYSAGLADELRVSDVARSGAEIHDIAEELGFTDPPVANEDAGASPEFAFHAPYPNPTTGSATFVFEIAQSGKVRLMVFDALGRRVAVLLDGERAAGRYEVAFDAGRLAAGLYLARLESGSTVATRPIMLTR